MKLTVAERIQFGLALPEKGDFVAMTLKQDILKKVNLTQKEIDDWGIHADGEKVSWDSTKAQDTDIEFTNSEVALVAKTLTDLDAKQMLDDMTVSLYRKFVVQN